LHRLGIVVGNEAVVQRTTHARHDLVASLGQDTQLQDISEPREDVAQIILACVVRDVAQEQLLVITELLRVARTTLLKV